MPVKTKSGKWRWGNVERDTKKDLAQTVWGIWKKNGSKGDFGKFFKTGKVNESDLQPNFKQIGFPEAEISVLKSREEKNLPIYTTRVADDFFEFRKGDIVITPWQSLYIVTAETVISDIDEHPFRKELTSGQVRFLSDFDKMKILTLEQIKDDILDFDGISDVEFKQVKKNELVALLDEIDTYNENMRYDRTQFEKYLGSDKTIDKYAIYYGLFRAGRCEALSYLNKVPNGFILLTQVTSFIKGSGKLLIENIMSRSPNMWLAADPKTDDPELLLNYYRQFGLKEHVIERCKWADGMTEHMFFKTASLDDETELLNYFKTFEV